MSVCVYIDEKSSLLDETSDLLAHLFIDIIQSDMDMLILDQSHMGGYSQSQQTPAVYLQDFRSEPCQVCGENASGWHCGSITW